jgi:hypothetical protein
VSGDPSHCATALVGVPADRAYAFLVDPVALGRWSLGCMDLEPIGDGVYRGHSLFDGSEGWLSIDGDPQRRVVDYHAGVRPRAVRVLRFAAGVAQRLHGRGALAAALRQPRRRDLADQGAAGSRALIDGNAA